VLFWIFSTPIPGSSSSSSSKDSLLPKKPSVQRAAIVRPFIPTHLDELVSDLKRWDQELTFPCSTSPPAYQLDFPGKEKSRIQVDLIFYFAYHLEEHPEGPSSKATLEQAVEAFSWRPCFNDVRYMSSGLNSSTDRYRPDEDAEKPASGMIISYFTHIDSLISLKVSY